MLLLKDNSRGNVVYHAVLLHKEERKGNGEGAEGREERKERSGIREREGGLS